MCYELILSTTSGEDLSQFNDEGIRFDNSHLARPSLNHLQYPNKVYRFADWMQLLVPASV